MKLITLIIIGLFMFSNQVSALNKLPQGVIKQDGRAASTFKLKDIDGELYNFESSKGKWVFVHFWATWCGPCRREIPAIQAITKKFENSKGLDIVIINTAESEDTVFSFLGLLAPDINPLMDDDGLVTKKWQPRGLPTTYFVDPKGKVRYMALGGRHWNKNEYYEFLKMLEKNAIK